MTNRGGYHFELVTCPYCKGEIRSNWYIRHLRKCRAAPTIDEAELFHICGVCGQALQLVRPGKYQCVHCESLSTNAERQA